MDKLFLALLVDGGPKFRASQCFQAVCKRPRVTKDSHRLKSPIPARGELWPKLNIKLPQPRSPAKLQISNELPEKPEGFYSSLPLQGWKKKKKSFESTLPTCWQGAGVVLGCFCRVLRLPREPLGAAGRPFCSGCWFSSNSLRVRVFSEDEFPCSTDLTDSSEVSRWEKNRFQRSETQRSETQRGINWL